MITTLIWNFNADYIMCYIPYKIIWLINLELIDREKRYLGWITRVNALFQGIHNKCNCGGLIFINKVRK